MDIEMVHMWRESSMRRFGVDYDPLKIVENAINEVYEHYATTLGFDELYSNAAYMVLQKNGQKLYCGIVSTMTSHIKQMAASIEASHGPLFLEELNRKWMQHDKAFDALRCIFMCMNKTCTPSTYKAHVQQLGVQLWVDNVIHSSNIQTRLKDTLLETVRRDRDGEVVNREMMKNTLAMLMELGRSVYQEEFEKPFLDELTKFYQGKSQQLFECCDCVDYLKEAEKCLKEESKRVSNYLDVKHHFAVKSVAKITPLVEKEMIEKYMPGLIDMENSGLVNMIVENKYDDLARMYNLFGKVSNGVTTINNVMTCHIRETGKQLVTDPERFKGPVDFVQQLLDERHKFDKIINLAFKNDMAFQNALNSSFEYFINLNPRCPEFISLFMHDKLRKAVHEEDEDIVLDKVVMLFCYLQEKGLFFKYYKCQLAKRLLLGKRVSEDSERSLLLKLKTKCGNLDISDLEDMLNDIKISHDTMQGFYEAMGPGLAADGPKLDVDVLSTVSWPSQLTRTTTCNLPPEIIRMCEKFRTYYLGTNKRRRLTWQTNMGSAVIKATFGTGKQYELNVSTHQMCVLVLFNNADQLSYKEIKQAVELPSMELKRCLQSLACAAEEEKNVLKKEPMNTDISEDDVFFVNEMFSSRWYKVKVGNGTVGVAHMESEPKKQETMQSVEEGRKSHIDALIPKIMKENVVMDFRQSCDRLQSNYNRECGPTLQ